MAKSSPLIPHGVKLRDLPLRTRLLLRLTTLEARRFKTASLQDLSKDVECKFFEAMKEIESAVKDGLVTIKALDAGKFSFQLNAELFQALRLAASSYDKHLKAEKTRVPKQSQEAPAHLPPITEEQRAPYMERGTMIATQLGAPDLAKKVANCIARLGHVAVDAVFTRAVEAKKSSPDSAVRLFFTIYTEERNRLMPPTAALTNSPVSPSESAQIQQA